MKSVSQAEKKYLKCHLHKFHKNVLRQDFINKRKYNKDMVLNLKNYVPTIQWNFGKKVKKLGPKKKSSNIPLEYVAETDDLITDKSSVLDKWKNAFEGLFKLDSSKFDDNFPNKKKRSREHHEDLQKDPLYNSNIDLNKRITECEVKTSILKSKDGKSTGYDLLPNEIKKMQVL